MKFKIEFENAFTEAQKIFPFENYIDQAKYRATYSIIDNIRKFLPTFNNKRLLDIGSGPMDKTGVFQKLGFQCYAVDDLQDPWHQRNGNIKKIKKYAKTLGINFYHQKFGEYTIPFEVDHFDVVCSFAVIEHLHESPRDLLNTMGLYARPGALIVIVMPNSVDLKKRLSVILGRTNYPKVDMLYYSFGTWRGHVREYTLSETKFICEASGFEILDSTTFEEVAYKKLNSPFLNLYLLLGNIIPTLRSSLLVLCRKPENWQPVKEDSEAYRKAIASGVPEGVS